MQHLNHDLYIISDSNTGAIYTGYVGSDPAFIKDNSTYPHQGNRSLESIIKVFKSVSSAARFRMFNHLSRSYEICPKPSLEIRKIRVRYCLTSEPVQIP